MNKFKLPKNLISISNAIVKHINLGSKLPGNLNELEKWFELDGWDLLVGNDCEIGLALDLQRLANYRFYDSEVSTEYEIEDAKKIDDSMRVEFGQEQINWATEDIDGYMCPSVHAVKLLDGNASAIIGCLIEIHGQGGPVPLWQGVYKTQEDFLKAIRANHIVILEEIKNISDQEILGLWNRK